MNVLTEKNNSAVRTLVKLEKCVKTNGQNVYVVTNALFSRMVVLMERLTDVTSFFKLELAPFPTSTLKNFQVRKTNKAVMKHHLNTDVSEPHPPINRFVLDVGALFNSVKCLHRVTYTEVAAQELIYVKDNYAPTNIIFYGYDAGPFLKDH